MPPPTTSGTRLCSSERRTTSTPGVPGPPTNLCGLMNTASLYAKRMLGALRVHLDVDVGRGAGEVPERQRPVAVEQVGDGAGVGHDARHVRRGGERADLQRPVGVAIELGFEPVPGRCGRRRPRGW